MPAHKRLAIEQNNICSTHSWLNHNARTTQKHSSAKQTFSEWFGNTSLPMVYTVTSYLGLYKGQRIFARPQVYNKINLSVSFPKSWTANIIDIQDPQILKYRDNRELKDWKEWGDLNHGNWI